MQKTLGEIADFIGGEVVGNDDLVITGLSGIKEAKEGELTFIANSKYFSFAEQTKASAIIIPLDVKVEGKSVVRVENPSLAFSKIAAVIMEEQAHRIQGIHETALINSDVKIGTNVAVGAYAVIEKGVNIGDNTVISSGCFVGSQTTIGSDCLIYPNVTIRERISIGDRVIIHSGTVVGSDGFGFVDVKGVHEKIPQIGKVVIQDDVEIGANVAIDRARFAETFIGRGTKIDNLVQIAHNVKIGEDCLIVSQVGISGSTTIGDRVILAGQVGVAGHLTIGEGVVVASKSGVPSSIPPNTMVWGNPAKPHMQAKRVNASVQRLPLYIKMINDLKKKVEELEQKFKKQ